MKKVLVVLLAMLVCSGLLACGGKASNKSYWNSRKNCLTEEGDEELMYSVWTNFENAEEYSEEPTYLAIMSRSGDVIGIWYGINYQYAKTTGYDYENTFQKEYVPYLHVSCRMKNEDGKIYFYEEDSEVQEGSVHEALKDFSCYIYEDSREVMEYFVNGKSGWMYHCEDYWYMDEGAAMDEIVVKAKIYDDVLDLRAWENGDSTGDDAGTTPTVTPTPTPTPTPLLTAELCEKLTGQTWKLESISSVNRGYGEPESVIIDSISPETAMVTYVVNTGTVDGDCMGLQYKDGEYYLELECSVKETSRGSIILTSEKQMREFHAYNKKKDPLCEIEIYPSDIKNMSCTFYSRERELVLVEELPEVGKEYSGTIYGTLDSIAIFRDMAAAVTKDHKLYMWGMDALDYVTDRPVKGSAIEPTMMAEGVIKVFAGSGSGFVIKEDNSLWGFNDYSAYADWDDSLDIYERNALKPYLNKIADNVKSVTCSGAIIAYVKEDGTVVVLEDAFGCNKSEIEKIKNVKKIVAGDSFVYALKEDGTLWGLGDNRDNVMGIEDKADYQTSYVQIMADVADVAVSAETSFVVKTDGTLWGWGYNESGQLGTWDFVGKRLPVKIMDDVSAISYYGGTIYAITKDAALYIWGGSGPISDSSNHPVKYLDSVIAAEEYSGVLMVVKSDGALYTAGNNNSRQLGYLTDDNRTTKPTKCLENILLPEEND